MSKKSNNKYLFPLIVMASLFFLLGFITTMNNSMIDFLKDAFNLNNVLKQLPNTFFYGAYILSIPVGFLIHRLGYKNGVLVGLGTIILGIFLAIPLVSLGYIPFLTAVFIFAFGIVILQVAANPYVNVLGKPETAASRLTLTNAMNSVATVIAPVFVSMLIVNEDSDPGAVKFPFILIGVITLAIFIIILFLKLPDIRKEEIEEIAEPIGPGTGEIKVENKSRDTLWPNKYKSSAFKYPHVWLGSLAIFFYVTIELGIPSFFADYSDKLGLSFSSQERIDMLKFYWGGLMVGRLLGIFILRKYSANQILGICSIGGPIFLAASLITGGSFNTVALWLYLGTGLFHSIMWPTIYNLSLEDLGPHDKVASGVISTAVIGVALLTPIMGAVQVATGTVVAAISFLFIFYGYLFFFAIKGSKIRS